MTVRECDKLTDLDVYVAAVSRQEGDGFSQEAHS